MKILSPPTHTNLCANFQSQEHRAKCWELQKECLDRQKHLSGLNDDVRQGLRNLEKKVEQLGLAKEPRVKEVAPNNDAAVQAVVAAVESITAVDGGGETTIREELRALKRKVDIIAANVLGEAEDGSMNVPTTGPSPDNGEDDETPRVDIETAEHVASVDGAENNAEGSSPTDDEGDSVVDKGNSQHEQEDASSVNPRLLPQRVRARTNWAKVRKNRVFLVKKIRRQVRGRASRINLEVSPPSIEMSAFRLHLNIGDSSRHLLLRSRVIVVDVIFSHPSHLFLGAFSRQNQLRVCPE